MDAGQFDILTRRLGLAGSRRRALGGVLLGALGLLGVPHDQTAAKKKKPCPPCKKRKKGKCKKGCINTTGSPQMKGRLCM